MNPLNWGVDQWQWFAIAFAYLLIFALTCLIGSALESIWKRIR